MAGNSQRRGATRKPGSKKGATVGSGGQRRAKLEGRGPTPKAEDRPHHVAAKRKRAAARARTTPTRTNRSSTYLFGRNPVVEALRAGVPATTLYVQSKGDADERIREAIDLANASGIALLEAPRGEMDSLADGGVHQGLMLVVPEYRYADLDDVAGSSLLIALDGVTDTRNLGAIARSGAAFGAGGIVVPSRRSVTVTAASWKASAGALTRVPVAEVTNLTRALTDLKKRGFTAVALDADGGTALVDVPRDVWTDPIVVVIGSEGSGVSRLVGETCDWRVMIPMAAGQESLNASVAAAIVLQRIHEARA
jgi:23S rRNA (guanosine2251-2'-O)-methyltransferase